MNYYEILNVSQNAPLNEITIAHKKLAMKLHPDRNKGDKNSEEKFKQVNKAYTILSNPVEREKYDQQLKEEKERAEAAKNPPPQSGRNNSNGNFNNSNHNTQSNPNNRQNQANFGSQNQYNEPRNNYEQTNNHFPIIKVNIDFWDAIKGGRQELEFYYNNNYYTTVVDLPEGVESGFQVAVKTNTDEIILAVNVADDLYYERSGLDLFARASIPMHIALLGGFITFPHFRGSIDVKIPPETQNGDSIRVAGFGVKKGNATGHLMLVANIELPTKLTSKQRELIKEFAVLESEKADGLFSGKTAQIWKNLMSKFS